MPDLQVNQDFEGMDPADLLNHSNWVHHYPHILNQGRCTFFSLKHHRDEDDEDEDDEIKEEIETGPRMLCEISEDSCITNLQTQINHLF